MPDDQSRADATTAPAPHSGRSDAQTGGKDGKPGFLRRHPLAVGAGLVVLALVAVLGYVYWRVDVRPYETTDDAFVDARQFAVAPKVAGYVVEVAVTDNQHVTAGDVLFRIDPRDYNAALDQAKAQVDAARAAITGADAQILAQRAQVDEARAQVEQAEASLRFAREDAARYQDLQARGAGTVQQFQQSNSNLLQQQANLSRANAALIAAQRQIGSLEAQRASAAADLARAEAQVAQAELNLSYTTVSAAQPGRIVRLSAARGQYVQAGQSLSMFVPDDVWVTANFKETQITDMRPGQPVDIRIDAYPDHTIRGRVDSVQPGSGTAFSLLPAENATGNYIKVVQRVPVKITVETWPTDITIGPGMSVVPTVTVR
ncbi:HlyD family secretion protein [Azospirillum sp. sgz302134]